MKNNELLETFLVVVITIVVVVVVFLVVDEIVSSPLHCLIISSFCKSESVSEYVCMYVNFQFIELLMQLII